jgi:hypothetical protein
VFFWTLVLGFASEAARGLASLQRLFCALTGKTITSSAFQKRFTPQAATWACPVSVDTYPLRERGCPDGQVSTAVPAGVPAADRRVGPRRPEAGGTRRGVRADRDDHPELGGAG